MVFSSNRACKESQRRGRGAPRSGANVQALLDSNVDLAPLLAAAVERAEDAAMLLSLMGVNREFQRLMVPAVERAAAQVTDALRKYERELRPLSRSTGERLPSKEELDRSTQRQRAAQETTRRWMGVAAADALFKVAAGRKDPNAPVMYGELGWPHPAGLVKSGTDGLEVTPRSLAACLRRRCELCGDHILLCTSNFNILPFTRRVLFASFDCLVDRCCLINECGTATNPYKLQENDQRAGSILASVHEQLRVAYGEPVLSLDAHYLRRTLKNNNAHMHELFAKVTYGRFHFLFVWPHAHPSVPRGYALQERLKLSQAQVNLVKASATRLECEKAKVAEAAWNAYKERLMLNLDDQIATSRLAPFGDSAGVDRELPGFLDACRILTYTGPWNKESERKTGWFKNVMDASGMYDLIATAEGILCQLRARDERGGERASPYAYSFLSGIPSALFGLRKRNERGFFGDIQSIHAALRRTLEQKAVLNSYYSSADEGIWGAYTIALHAFDALSWESLTMQSTDRTWCAALGDQKIVGGCTPTVHLVSTVEHIATAALFDLGIDPSAVALALRENNGQPAYQDCCISNRETVARMLCFHPGSRALGITLLIGNEVTRFVYAVARARCRPDEIRRAAAAARCAGVPMPSTEKD